MKKRKKIWRKCGTQSYFPTKLWENLEDCLLKVPSLQFYLRQFLGARCIINVAITGSLHGRDGQTHWAPLLPSVALNVSLVSEMRNISANKLSQLIKKVWLLNALKIKLNNNYVLRMKFQVYFSVLEVRLMMVGFGVCQVLMLTLAIWHCKTGNALDP